MDIELIIGIVYVIIAIIAAAISSVYIEEYNVPPFITGVFWPIALLAIIIYYPYKQLVILIKKLKDEKFRDY